MIDEITGEYRDSNGCWHESYDTYLDELYDKAERDFEYEREDK